MSTHDASTPVWFITGCSTGLGRAIAQAVLTRGWRVALTARNPATVSDLADAHPGRALALELDVTRTTQVAAAVERTRQAFGRIDVLVNNAGYGYLAAVEEGVAADVRALFDTNFFGLVEVTQAVLPLMRAQRSGHILNISSVRGISGAAGSAYYCASKFAVEGLSESLRLETAPLGIRVTCVEPGAFRTDWAGRSMKITQHTVDAYPASASRRKADMAARDGRQPGDPARAAQALIALVSASDPPGHLVLGKPGLQTVRSKIRELNAELAAWESVTLSADFPD